VSSPRRFDRVTRFGAFPRKDHTIPAEAGTPTAKLLTSLQGLDPLPHAICTMARRCEDTAPYLTALPFCAFFNRNRFRSLDDRFNSQ